MAAGFLSVLGKRLVCLEMQIAFDAEMEAVADQGKLGQADVAQLRETEAEERVAVFWIDLRDQPGGRAARVEEFDHGDMIFTRLPIAYELFQEGGR